MQWGGLTLEARADIAICCPCCHDLIQQFVSMLCFYGNIAIKNSLQESAWCRSYTLQLYYHEKGWF